MRATVIYIVTDVLGTVPKGLKKDGRNGKRRKNRDLPDLNTVVIG